MLKNIILAAMLIAAFPVLANAWTFQLGLTNNTAGINAGNKVTVTIAGTATDVTAGTKYFYPASTVTSVSVAIANIGNVTSITLDGATQPLTTPVVVLKGTASSHVLNVVYSANVVPKRDVTVTQSAGGLTSLHLGTSSVTTSLFTGVPVGTSLNVVAQPSSGYKLRSIMINGVEQVTDAASGLGSTSAITKSFLVDASFTPNTVLATYDIVPSVTAALSLSGSSIAGTQAQAIASASSNVSPLNYDFSTTCSTQTQTGPAATFPFTPTAAGTCSVSVTVTGPGASTVATLTFTVASATDATNYVCTQCHATSTPLPVNEYNGSRHYQKITCQNCHTDTPHNGLPSGTVCAGCHADTSGTVPNHPVDIGGNPCTLCHNPHSTVATLTPAMQGVHYNNITSGMYPASFVTSRAVCANCHFSSAANAVIRQQWYTSGHAKIKDLPWINDDFKTESGCVQCHTTTGFIAYSTGRVTAAWGVSSDKTKEVLTCIGCHQDMTTGVLRTVTPVAPYADDNYVNPNVGKSNICMDCHSGTKNGKSINARLEALTDFGNTGFIDPHYLAAGGSLYGKVGYHFPGRSYSSSATHAGLGGTDGSGPCVTCHKNSDNGHTFKAGAVTLCANCHGSSLSAARLIAAKQDFSAALETLRVQLAAKGFVYSPTYPYFTNRNWGSGQAGANTMGAAFNYVLLLSEPGAYAHDPTYARQLLLDSIDYLDNGQIDDSVLSIALPTLVTGQGLSTAAVQGTTTLRNKDNCTVCHGFTASSSNPIASNAHGAHISGTYGPGTLLGSDVTACQTCHVVGQGTHLDGVVETVTGAGSACANCHPGTIPAWTGTSRLACTSCHAAVPSVLPNTTAAPYKQLFGTSGHGQFAVSNQCTSCHDANSSHITGVLGDGVRLLLPNDAGLCSSCHNDPAKVTDPLFRNMSSNHADKTCLDCHDPHGTGNLSMIRTTINGTAITFSDKTNGFIQTSPPYRGLCQVCHTLTNHYKAGVYETNHPTSNCLGCHSHTSPGGAFRPVGGACDGCHGYPPAPRAPALSFGAPDNYENARFEDYSGGGGAHLVMAHISPYAKPSEGWANCAICHNGGRVDSAPHHQMVTPVRSHISNVHVEVDPQYRFSNSFTIYTGAKQFDPPARNVTGSCFNINCHMSPSPRWSSER